MDQKHLILRWLLDHPSPEARRVSSLIESPETALVSMQPSRVRVSEALKLWSTRAEVMRVSGVQIDGLDSLVEKLKSFHPNSKLDQVDVVGKSVAGILVFREHSLLGVALAPKRSAEEEKKRHAALFNTGTDAKSVATA